MTLNCIKWMGEITISLMNCVQPSCYKFSFYAFLVPQLDMKQRLVAQSNSIFGTLSDKKAWSASECLGSMESKFI